MGSKGIVASTAALAHPAAAGHRRHHPRLADAGARRRPHARGDRRAGDPADHGPPRLRAAGHRLPGLRPHDQHRLPGTGQRASRATCASACRLARAIPGRRGADGRGDGLRRQRPGREQARRHRHLPARHRRGAGGAGLRRRREDRDPARREHRRRSSPRSSTTTWRAASVPWKWPCPWSRRRPPRRHEGSRPGPVNRGSRHGTRTKQPRLCGDGRPAVPPCSWGWSRSAWRQASAPSASARSPWAPRSTNGC